ncbi:MAG: hypothetical protein ABUR63_07740 [Verrucomicrobiota bacterium]
MPFVVIVAVASLLTMDSAPARACSAGQAATPTALPRTGAADVSTATSIVVLSPAEPFGLILLVDGQPVPVMGWTALGGGLDDGGGPTSFWRLRLGAGSMLNGSARYALSLPGAGADAGVAQLTEFTTAAGYDKASGTAPTLRGFRLWRVRYPVADIGAGQCVFSEYHSFITVDYEPASVPNTPPASVVHGFQLSPKNGGSTQTFTFTGSAPFTGLAPAGDYPLPLGQWQPELDPSRTYCLTIMAFGDGDLARPSVSSNQLCVGVTQLSSAGAPGTDRGGGCAAAGPVPAQGSVALATFSMLMLLLGFRGTRHRANVGRCFLPGPATSRADDRHDLC